MKIITVYFCLAVRFSNFGRNGHIMAMVTMAQAILSRISDGYGQYLANH
jgi:hypothetical protein